MAFVPHIFQFASKNFPHIHFGPIDQANTEGLIPLGHPFDIDASCRVRTKYGLCCKYLQDDGARFSYEAQNWRSPGCSRSLWSMTKTKYKKQKKRARKSLNLWQKLGPLQLTKFFFAGNDKIISKHYSLQFLDNLLFIYSPDKLLLMNSSKGQKFQKLHKTKWLPFDNWS